MFSNYLLSAWRHLKRNKMFTVLNLLGLAAGMTACLLIMQYVSYERSYDGFHENADRVYRATLSLSKEGKRLVAVPKNAAAAGPALKREFPEVKDFVRIFPIDGTIAIRRGGVVFNEKGIYFADPSVLRVFSFPLLKGNAATALTEPGTVVLTATAAKRYFGSEDPLGKTLMLREGRQDFPLTVQGVLADIPENTHLTFQFLISHATLRTAWGEKRAEHDWSSAVFYTYLLLQPEASPQAVARKLPGFIRKYMNWGGPDARIDFQLQPLRDIYLYSDLVQEAKVNGSGRQVTFLLLVGLGIMVIAWINYVNLATAGSLRRAREVGIRKVVGASRAQLWKQFVLESVLHNGLAGLLALTLAQALAPAFRQLTGKAIPLWHDPVVTIALAAFLVAGTLLSAAYPSLVLSGFEPIRVLKGRFIASRSGNGLRKGLIVVQFAASVALITGTLTVYRQLSFMQEKELGLHLEQTLVMVNPDVVDSTFESKVQFFKQSLLQHPEIKYVVSANSIPGKPDNLIQGGLQKAEDHNRDNGINHYGFRVDHQFVDAFGLRLLAGRNFSRKMGTDKDAVLLNQTALRGLGYRHPAEAIGKKVVTNWTGPKTIIGVVADFHQQSLKTAFDPIVLVLDESGAFGYYAVKINPQGVASLPRTIQLVRAQWEAAFPGNPFEYFFLDAYFNAQYQSDHRFGRVFTLFSGLAILIACLGLFGLSLFSAVQRTKEVGIRKVHGATTGRLLVLLSGDFVRLVLVANLIAWPLAYLGVREWLAHYAFRIDISPGLFVLPSLLVLAVALLTVSVQTLKAARTRPADSLRSE
jgi:putative ABC transport system permease protein